MTPAMDTFPAEALWVARDCPLCLSQRDSEVFAESNFRAEGLDRFAFASRKLPEYLHTRLLICVSCDLVYSSPALEQQVLADCYRDADFDSGLESAFAAQSYASLLQPVLQSLPKPLSALDIGCGDGAFLTRLRAAGVENVEGIEPSTAPLQAAVPEIRDKIRWGIFEPADYPANSFSLITCFQVMEHIWDPLELSKGALKLLKPGGALAIIVHDRRAISAKLLGHKSPIFDIEHLQLFTRVSCERLLKEAGFTDISVRSIWNTYPLHYWLKLFPFPRGWKLKIIALAKFLGIANISLSIPPGNLLVLAKRP
jgi:SAM-dependent methyltransferase